MFEVGQIQLVWSIRHAPEEAQPSVSNLGIFSSEVVYWEATKKEEAVKLRHRDDFVQGEGMEKEEGQGQILQKCTYR